ncbi:MAG: hypothetical protein PVF17_12515 [Ignavibacteria bacterium]|jgi:hypothetical protein
MNKDLIVELIRIKNQFLYHKALVGYIAPNPSLPEFNFKYCSGGYYKTKACINIIENGLSREEHNEASHSVNQWFLVYCSELIKEEMKGKPGFDKVNDKKPLNDFTNCQLLYILRDKLAHSVYRAKKIGMDKPKPYLSEDVAKEIYRRFNFEISHKDNNTFSLPVDKVIIPMIDSCIEEIRRS